MKKMLTKEDLAAQLDGCEYRNGIPTAIGQAAKKNNLLIITGASDDLIELHGAIHEEVGITDILLLTRNGIPESDCKAGEDCCYHRRWLKAALKSGEAKTINIFWGGESGRETMEPEKYAALGEPTWCFETTMPYAGFSIFDTDGVDREFFCRGIVIDLSTVFPSRSYEQMVK